MPFTLIDFPSPADSPRRSWQKCAAALLLAIVAGCGGSNQPGVIEPVEGFFGGAAADEPRAAIAGRDVLVAGGSAVDAAVAMGFTLAVTLPSSAGLGGGGACVTFDGRTVTPTLFDFPAMTAGASRIAVPALVRGMALLHARHGRIAWSQLLGPAETAARFGTPVSRALAHDLAQAPTDLARDPATARIFAPGGALVREGDTLVQLDLATILGQLRQKGAGEFYLGVMPRTFAEASQGALPIEALRGYLPQVTAPPVIGISSQQQFVIVGDSPSTAALFGRLLSLGVEAGPSAADRPRFWAEAGAAAEGHLAEALSRGRADIVPPAAEIAGLASRVKTGTHERPAKTLGALAPARAGATSFVAADKNGLAVACALGLNAAWGTGRVLSGTGILTAPPPTVDGPRAVGVIAAAPGNGVIYLTASAAGRASPSALAQVALAAVSERQEIATILSRPRVAYDGAEDVARIEPGLPQDSLTRGGLKSVETAPLGFVNAVSCVDELVRGRATCRSATDTRGAGLAFGGGTGAISATGSGSGGVRPR